MGAVAQLGSAIMELGVNLKDYASELSRAEGMTRTATSEMQHIAAAGKVGSGWAQGITAVSTAYTALLPTLQKGKALFLESIQIAAEKAEVDENLRLVAGKYADETFRLAAALQKKLGIDDDLITGLAAQAGAMNLQKDSLDDAALAAYEYSKIMKIDVDSALRIVVGGAHGVGRGLNRLGIEVDANASQQENLTKILAGLTGGMTLAEREAGRMSGAWGRMLTWVDEGKEKFGATVVENQKVKQSLMDIAGVIERAVESGDLTTFSDDIGDIAEGMAALSHAAGPTFEYIRSYILGGWFKDAVNQFGDWEMSMMGLGEKADAAAPQIEAATKAIEGSSAATEVAAKKWDMWGNEVVEAGGAAASATSALAGITEQASVRVTKAWEDMSLAEKVYGPNADVARWQKDFDAAIDEIHKVQQQHRIATQEINRDIMDTYMSADAGFKGFLEGQYDGIEKLIPAWKEYEYNVASAGEKQKILYERAVEHSKVVMNSTQALHDLGDTNTQVVADMIQSWDLVIDDVSRFNAAVSNALGGMDMLRGYTTQSQMTPDEMIAKAKDLLSPSYGYTGYGPAMGGAFGPSYQQSQAAQQQDLQSRQQTALMLLEQAARMQQNNAQTQQLLQQFLSGGGNPYSGNLPGNSPSKPSFVKIVGNGADAAALGF